MSELLTKLGIDWRLLIAQIVNFCILFVILRKFLYRPVLGILEDRRVRITEGLRDAEQAKARLAGVELERKDVLHRAEVERASLLEHAAVEAEELRAQRSVSADGEARAILERAKRDAERTREELLADVRREVGDLLLSVSRKVTAEALTAAEHRKLVDAAIGELDRAVL